MIKEQLIFPTKGRLIYRNEKTILIQSIISGIVLIWVAIWICSYQSMTMGYIISALFTILFSSGLAYLLVKELNHNPGFYERGIGYFQHNKLIRFEPYDSFLSVECYFVRRYRREYLEHKLRSEYVLIFYHLDGSSIELIQDSSRALEQIWKQIVSYNPTLVGRLSEHVVLDSLGKPNPLKKHHESKRLFESLKNIQYDY